MVADKITYFSSRDPTSTAHSPQCTQCLTPRQDKTVDRQRSACPAWSTATWNRKAFQQYCMCHCTCTVFHWLVVGLILMRSGSREPSVCPPQVVFCLNYMMISWDSLIQFSTVTLNFAQINNKRSSWCVFFLKLGFGCWCNYIFISRVNCSRFSPHHGS